MFQDRISSAKSRLQTSQTLVTGLVAALVLFGVPYSFAAEVNHCSDADTCWVKDQGREFKVRLSGVDAPESDQPYGQEAKRFMNQLVGHKQVTLKCDGTSYDRRTCDIFLGAEDVSATLVRAGYAWDYPEFSKGRYAKEQESAMARRAGLWNDSHPTSPYCWRWAGKPKCNVIPTYEP